MHEQFDRPWLLVAEIAAAQEGRISYEQLVAAGLGRGAIHHGVRSGRLFAEHRGVYLVGHPGTSAVGRYAGAVLAGGDGALLSHRSAATLLRIRSAEGPRIDVTVPVRSGRSRPGIAFHRSPVHLEDRSRQDGVPVTSVARTLVDLAKCLKDEDEVRRALREAQFLRVFDLEATRRAVERRPSRLLRGILDELAAADSVAEDAFMALVDRFSIPRPVPQYLLLGHRVDYAWPEARLAVEIDGRRAHATDDAFQRDRSQSNAMQLAAWLVLRFTWADVTRRQRKTADEVLRGLRRPLHVMHEQLV